MRVVWPVFVALLIWTSSSEAACSGTSPIWTSTPDQASFSTCLANASSGDRINISAGSATWTSAVSFPTTKDLTVTGAGIGNTVLTCPSPYCFAVPQNHTTVISGLEIHTGFDPMRYRGGGDAVVGKTHRFHHNKVVRTGGGFGELSITGDPNSCNKTPQVHPSVLLDHNEFVDVRVLVVGTACSLVDGNAQHILWSQNPRPNAPVGTWPEIVYVEDNVFTNSGVLIDFIDCNYGGRYVLRFNTITSTGSGTYAEVHGVQGGNRACQWKEMYHNTHTAVTPAFFGFAYIRSGSGVLFANRVDANAQVMRLNNERSYSLNICNGTSNWDGNTGAHGYPCRDQVGRMMDNTLWNGTTVPAYAQDLVPFYFWNNYTGTGTTQYVPDNHPAAGSSDGNLLADHIVKNRDWYTENTLFNGTSGVGVGPIDSRPSSCRVGVAYWATDQGEWNTNNAGNDGQLYKCTSTNNWSLYYRPFPYPHPLQAGGGGGGADRTAPIAPINLAIQ